MRENGWRSKFPICCLIVGSLLAIAAYAADDIGRKLNDSYKGKALVFRNFYSADNLQYNAQGELIGSSAQAPWTVARVLIKSVKLKSGVLRIEGNRALGWRGPSGQLQNRKLKDKVQIEAPVPAGASASDVDTLVQKIFFVDQADLISSLPAYWQAFLDAQKNPASAKPKEVKMPNGLTVFVSAPVTGSAPGQAPLYKVGAGVKAPKPLHNPDPEYEEAARMARFQGTCILSIVVDKEGNPKDIRIVLPLGAGLDEKAVAAVSSWRFEPATLDGQPVPVLVNVEVNFRLY